MFNHRQDTATAVDRERETEKSSLIKMVQDNESGSGTNDTHAAATTIVDSKCEERPIPTKARLSPLE